MTSAIASAETPRDILANTPFFADVLDARGLETLSSRLRVTEHAKGTTLIREDDIGSSMFVLVSGEVTITVPGKHGTRHVATRQAPEIIGEMSLLTGARRSATVTARTTVKVVEIPKMALAPLIAATPQLADRFATMVAKRQHELDRIYRGEGRWNLFDFGGKDLGSVIRGFFGGTV